MKNTSGPNKLRTVTVELAVDSYCRHRSRATNILWVWPGKSPSLRKASRLRPRRLNSVKGKSPRISHGARLSRLAMSSEVLSMTLLLFFSPHPCFMNVYRIGQTASHRSCLRQSILHCGQCNMANIALSNNIATGYNKYHSYNNIIQTRSLTLGACARGLQYFVCLSVCLFVCLLPVFWFLFKFI